MIVTLMKQKKVQVSRYTDLERTLLELLVAGHLDREIAKVIGYEPGTVRVYMHQLYRKMGVSTRTQAAVKALREGLVK